MSGEDRTAPHCVVCDAEKASFRCRQCRSQYCSAACFKRHQMSPQQAAAAAEAAEGSTASASFSHLCEVILAAQQPERERTLKRLRTEAEADVFSDLSREKATATAGIPPHQQRNGSSEGAECVAKTSSPAAEKADDHHVQTSPKPQDSSSSKKATVANAGGAVGDGEVAGDADAVYILQETHLRALANDSNVRAALRSPSLQKLIRTIDSSRSRLDALDAAQYNNADFKHFCNDVMRAIARVEGR